MDAVVLNESFKALVREVFPDKSEKVLTIFDEVVRSKAANDSLSVQELKARASDDIRGELATRDFVRAEILQAKEELQETLATRDFVRGEVEKAKNDILRWVFGLQAGTIAVVLGGMKLMLG